MVKGPLSECSERERLGSTLFNARNSSREKSCDERSSWWWLRWWSSPPPLLVSSFMKGWLPPSSLRSIIIFQNEADDGLFFFFLWPSFSSLQSLSSRWSSLSSSWNFYTSSRNKKRQRSFELWTHKFYSEKKKNCCSIKNESRTRGWRR